MPVYQINIEGESHLVEAPSFPAAVLGVKQCIAGMRGVPIQETDDPEQVVLIGDEVIRVGDRGEVLSP